MEFKAEQTYLQPPEHQTDIVRIVKRRDRGRDRRDRALHEDHRVTDGVDLVTQDMVIAILADEQGHRRLFEGFLREYEAEGWRRGSLA